MLSKRKLYYLRECKNVIVQREKVQKNFSIQYIITDKSPILRILKNFFHQLGLCSTPFDNNGREHTINMMILRS